MPPTVKLSDVLEAMEASGTEIDHYLDKRTGEIVTRKQHSLHSRRRGRRLRRYDVTSDQDQTRSRPLPASLL